MTEPTREQAEQIIVYWRLLMRTYQEALLPVVENAVKVFEELQRALQDAGLLDEEGNPVRVPDRPAWQSPYGPPQKRGQ